MTRTVLSSASKEVVIGFDEPFCIIGERINPTGRKKLSEQMKAGDIRPSRPMRWRRLRLARTCWM